MVFFRCVRVVLKVYDSLCLAWKWTLVDTHEAGGQVLIRGTSRSTCVLEVHKRDLLALQFVKDLLHEFALPR